jgi:hypothetical protein
LLGRLRLKDLDPSNFYRDDDPTGKHSLSAKYITVILDVGSRAVDRQGRDDKAHVANKKDAGFVKWWKQLGNQRAQTAGDALTR